MDKQVQPFSSRAQFSGLLQEALARAQQSLQLFDPDFSLWNLGSSASDAALRHFLSRGGHLQLAAHSNADLERNAPRLLHLLKDYSHAMECRLTSKNLRQLSDSFCIVDRRDIVRRFHADHTRGEAIFDGPAEVEPYVNRFEAIWAETLPGLHASTTGL